ncbi:unnamed protein product [Diabrotica balteata]|uniref:Uncharacterized protein n=1 Tax=Diabrotica balteata TaxID=107213 RepID=A0A9N9X8X3_DIABA|nr:unnamed protein product [Diabrotica balteata]
MEIEQERRITRNTKELRVKDRLEYKVTSMAMYKEKVQEIIMDRKENKQAGSITCKVYRVQGHGPCKENKIIALCTRSKISERHFLEEENAALGIYDNANYVIATDTDNNMPGTSLLRVDLLPELRDNLQISDFVSNNDDASIKDPNYESDSSSSSLLHVIVLAQAKKFFGDIPDLYDLNNLAVSAAKVAILIINNKTHSNISISKDSYSHEENPYQKSNNPRFRQYQNVNDQDL